MMKKFTKAALLLAAGAAFLFAACSHSSDGGGYFPQRNLESISVAADGNVKDHYDGNEPDFDPTGLTVTAYYDDDTTEDVTKDATFIATYEDEDGVEKPFPVAEKNIYEVTVTARYGGKEDTLNAPIIITVGDVVLESISMAAVGEVKTTYKQGEPIDPTGIEVTAHYDNGSEKVVRNSEVEFWATYRVGEEDKPFTTNLEPDVYNNVTLFATYKEKTANLPATTITIEENDVEEKTYFTSFLASDLLVSGAETTISATEADDKTWSIVLASANSKPKAKPASITTYDDKTYEARLSAESSNVGSIKLKIGAGQTKILRVDAGNSKGNITETEDGTIVVGGTTWAVQLAASTKYFKVTGDNDGYVTIDLKSNKSNIYAITVADALVDTSTIERTAVKVTYNPPVITLKENADTNSPLTAEVAKPTKTTTTYTAKADGVAAPTTADNPEELTDITPTYAWSKGGVPISDATGLTYTPTAGGVYTFTASYTAEDGKPYSASKNVTVMSSTTYTVTFEAGEGSFASGEKTKFTVHEELTLKEEYPDFKEPKPTAPEGKVFTEWKSSVEKTTIDDPITQDVIFTAQYGDKPTTTTYTLTPDMIKDSGTASSQGSYVTITEDGAKFMIGSGVSYDSSKIGVPAIATAGSAQKDGKNCIILTTTQDNVVVTVKFSATNGDGRHIAAIAGLAAAVNSGKPTADAICDTTHTVTTAKEFVTASITLPKAGQYSIGGTNGIYITEISLEM